MSARVHILPQPEFTALPYHHVPTPEGEVIFEKVYHTLQLDDGSSMTFVTWRLT